MHPHPTRICILHQATDIAVLAGLYVLDCEAADADIGIIPTQALELVQTTGAVPDRNTLLFCLCFKAHSHAFYSVITYDGIHIQLEEMLHVVAVDKVDVPTQVAIPIYWL